MTWVIVEAVAYDLDRVLDVAWAYRERALVQRQTSVGAAALASDGTIYGGCNVQQRFSSHDVHAEVNAITTMVAEGRRDLVAIAVVAEVEGLAPCGSCLDWILQLGGDDCVIVCQDGQSRPVEERRAVEMLPNHPRYDGA